MRSDAFKRALDWIYPRRAVCMGCGDASGFEADWICPECRKSMIRHSIGAFPDAMLDGSAAAYDYRGPAGNVVRRFKYGGAYELCESMTDSMMRAYERIMPTGAEAVTAVPMHPSRQRKRGYNHAQLLGRCVSDRLHIPYEPLLLRTRNTVQQAKLQGASRYGSLVGVFEAQGRVEGRRILLVDDVYTTGETAHRCAEALREAGAQTVSFLSYAKSVPAKS